MTRNPNIARNALRPAAVLLLATVAIPSTALAQDTVTPPVVLAPTAPAPVQAPAPAPAPAAQTAPGESRTTIAPGVVEQAQQETRERAATRRAERPAPAARTAPARQGAPAAGAATAPAASAPPVEAPVAAAPVTPAAPPAQTEPVPATPVESATAETTTTTTEQPASNGGSLWLVLAGLGVIAAAIAAFLLLRRRRNDDDAYDEYVEPAPVYAEPVAVTPVAEPRPVLTPEAVAVAAPLATHHRVDAAPRHEPEVHAALDHATLSQPDADDIDAVLGGNSPQGDRPQLELAMRPIRAGVNRDEGVVEFELTVANAGGVEAQDVRVAAFMLSDRPGQDGAIERLLIDPPADATIDADTIAPGGGARIDAAVTLPRDDLYVASDGAGHDGFTPVVLADARYRLPDGSEGRTAAAFTIGRANGDEVLMPIALDDEPAMYADIEARLHSVPAKV